MVTCKLEKFGLFVAKFIYKNLYVTLLCCGKWKNWSPHYLSYTNFMIYAYPSPLKIALKSQWLWIATVTNDEAELKN